MSKLVLSRQRDEQIMIGDDVIITVEDISRGVIRLSIEAPATTAVHRREVYDHIMARDGHVSPGGRAGTASGDRAVTVGGGPVPRGPAYVGGGGGSAVRGRTLMGGGPRPVDRGDMPRTATDRTAATHGPYGLPVGLGDESWEAGEGGGD